MVQQICDDAIQECKGVKDHKESECADQEHAKSKSEEQTMIKESLQTYDQPTAETVLCNVKSFEEWPLQDDSLKGYLVERNWDTRGERFHCLVELLSRQQQIRNYHFFDEQIHVHLGTKQRSASEVEEILKANADELMARITKVETEPGLMTDLKIELVSLIRADALAIAKRLVETINPPEIIFRVETIGLNRCSRWHRDAYTGRGICTYNGVATQYQDDSNVDFAKFADYNSDVNARCLIDPSKTRQCNAGDVLYMRGSMGGFGGLVHRSPLPIFWPNGMVCQRLCLKVDVPKGGSCRAAQEPDSVRTQRAAEIAEAGECTDSGCTDVNC